MSKVKFSLKSFTPPENPIFEKGTFQFNFLKKSELPHVPPAKTGNALIIGGLTRKMAIRKFMEEYPGQLFSMDEYHV